MLTNNKVRKEIILIIKVNFMNKSSSTSDHKAATVVAEAVWLYNHSIIYYGAQCQGLADWRDVLLAQTHNQLGIFFILTFNVNINMEKVIFISRKKQNKKQRKAFKIQLKALLN